MREICTSGSVGGEGGNILAYPAFFAGNKAAPDFALMSFVKPWERNSPSSQGFALEALDAMIVQWWERGGFLFSPAVHRHASDSGRTSFFSITSSVNYQRNAHPARVCKSSECRELGKKCTCLRNQRAGPFQQRDESWQLWRIEP
jgi:hypothetical protein